MSQPSARRITATKRSSLEGLAEGWGPECFALVAPATYADQLAIDDLNLTTKTPKEQIDAQNDVVRAHFIGGKVNLFDPATGEYTLVSMEVEDCFASVAITDRIYADIMGFELDPKDIRRAVAENALLPTSSESTETPSSTAPDESRQESPQS